jgi:hypothetical protein
MADDIVANQMANHLGKALNKASPGGEARIEPGFKWSNKGSMVFIGDKSVCDPL